jgi:hypothetical protein
MGCYGSRLIYFTRFQAILILICAFPAAIAGEITGTGGVPAPAGAVWEFPGAEARRIILVKGNEWVFGLPGLGENALTALYGLYSSEFDDFPGETTAQDQRRGTLSIWLSQEWLYFSEARWEKRPDISAYRVLQRYEGDTLLVAVFPERRPAGGGWTIFIQFPERGSAAGLNDRAVNRLIEAWTSRCLHFLSLAETKADVSLPAVVFF